MTEKINEAVTKITVGEYNSYLIKGGEKTALVCACENGNAAELLESIGEKLDYIAFCGAEAIFAETAQMLFERFPDARLLATGAAIRNLKQILNREFCSVPVCDGEKIGLGGMSLEILVTPNLFRPDTMMLYCAEKSVLFSGRAFSDCTGRREYMHFPEFARAAAERVSRLGAERILPCIGEYAAAELETGKKYDAGVFYYSETGSTERLAKAAAEGLKSGGADVCVVNLAKDGANIEKSLDICDKIFIGTPTKYRGLPKRIWELISKIDAASSSGRGFFVFGSYGWSGEAVQIVSAALKMLRMDSLREPYRVAFCPTAEDEAKIYDIAKRIAEEK